jgi:hypothetical protein
MVYYYFQYWAQQFNTILTFPKVVMSLYILPGNGEFPISNRHRLCLEIIHTEKEEPKRWDISRLACQRTENQDRRTIFNQTVCSIGWLLENGDNNMVKYWQQTATFVTDRLTKPFSDHRSSSSKVI